MNEVVDELLTPGCPQCAVKHLSAALFHVAAGHLDPFEAMLAHPAGVHMCIAAVNLAEVRAGYRSHLWYAVGALVQAEQCAATVPTGDLGRVARDARLLLEQGGEAAAIDALRHLRANTAPSHDEWAVAHFLEAIRELPLMEASIRMDDLVGSIERIRREYFPAELPTVPQADHEASAAASSEGAGEGGESAMATKKAAKKPQVAKSAGKAKAVQACGKGGKCKK